MTIDWFRIRIVGKDYPKNQTHKVKMATKIAMRDGGLICHYCGRPLIPHGDEPKHCAVIDMSNNRQKFVLGSCSDYRFINFDHLIPQRATGSNFDMHRMVLCCSPCNASKGTGNYNDFRATMVMERINREYHRTLVIEGDGFVMYEAAK